MRRYWSMPLTLFVLAYPVHAGVAVVADGVLRQVCSDTNRTGHPQSLDLGQVLPRSFSGSTAIGLTLLYATDDTRASRKGKVRSKAMLVRADGSEVDLASFDTLIDAATGGGRSEAAVEFEIERDDALIWELDFRRFKALSPGRCVLVAAFLNRDIGSD